MKLNKLFEEFIIKKSQTVKRGTLENYKGHFLHFTNWTKARGIDDTKQIDDKVFYEYLMDIQETCKNRTLNIRFGNLKRIYHDMNIKSKFLESYEKRKEQYTTFDMVEFDSLKEIRKYLYSLPKTPLNDFHAAIILLLIETGCRSNELLNIEVKNVNWEHREIRLTTTKTDEDRFVYFHKKTAPIIKRLLKQKHDHKFLLHNPSKNRAINFYDLRYMILKIKDLFKLQKFHAHMLRHSFATKLVEEKVPDVVIMAMTGHTNAETFRRYTHIRKYKIRQMYDDSFNLD